MFVVLESKQLIPAQGFEHVKGYAGFAAGKLKGLQRTCFIFPYVGNSNPN